LKSKLHCFSAIFILLHPLFAQYRAAAPGYRYEFPRDHFNHPEFQTEWWYYTGNIKSQDGHRFGFELTFFRQAVHHHDPQEKYGAGKSVWTAQDVYLAHLAFSDLDGGAYLHTERMNRAGPGLAGVSESGQHIWNGNWRVHWTAETQELEAIDPRFELHLKLRPLKPPVIHGENGVSQKSAGSGHASHYISLTRLETRGILSRNGTSTEVSGLSWMDHEFFTQEMAADQAGWDWLSLQLDNHTELMLYRFRRKDGSVDPYSSGTYIDPSGKSFHLRADDFSLQPQGEMWTSPDTRAIYPVHWKISIPKLEINLDVTTPLKSQEFAGESSLIPNYWEGAINLSGQRADRPVTGAGYLEMTGYDRPVKLTP
jgi:predicted secreted hydrolase